MKGVDNIGIMNFFGNLGNSFFGLIIKLIIILLVIVFVLALIVVLAVNWPFTAALIIGLLFSPIIYRRLNRQFALRLPKFFYHDIQDLMVTFRHGQERIDVKQLELNNKMIKAREHLQEILNATNSIEEQLKQVKTKRSLKTLLKKPASQINPRAAQALENEFGKPLWSQFLDKNNKNGNGNWEKFKSVPDVELNNSD